MPSLLIPLEYLPAARLGYPWGRRGELTGQQASRHGIFCNGCAGLPCTHCPQDCAGIMQPYQSRSQGGNIIATVGIRQQQVILMVNVCCKVLDIHDNPMVGISIGYIRESCLVGPLVILTEILVVQILNEILAFQSVLKDNRIHMFVLSATKSRCYVG